MYLCAWHSSGSHHTWSWLYFSVLVGAKFKQITCTHCESSWQYAIENESHHLTPVIRVFSDHSPNELVCLVLPEYKIGT